MGRKSVGEIGNVQSASVIFNFLNCVLQNVDRNPLIERKFQTEPFSKTWYSINSQVPSDVLKSYFLFVEN